MLQPIAAVRRFSRRDWAAALLALWALLVLVQPPLFPEGGLDPSWVLANEYAANHGFLFGRDFIFTYGPLGFLSTHLYRQSTYGFVLAADLLLTALFLIPLLWSRNILVLALYLVAIVAAAINPLSYDARVIAALLVVAMLAITGRVGPAACCTALMVPLLLSKFSYAVVALPFLIIADGYLLVKAKRLPVLLAICIAGLALGMVATGHPAAQLPLLIANIGEIVSGYGEAMAIDLGGIYPLIAAFVAMLGMAALALVMALRDKSRSADRWRMAAALGGIGWAIFIAFKMGHVRQDLHITVTWYAYLLIVPIVLAFFDRLSPMDLREKVAGIILALGALVVVAGLDAAIYFHHHGIRPIALLADRTILISDRPLQTLAWLRPAHWRANSLRRAQAETDIANRLPRDIGGTIDVIPSELAPAIVGQAQYKPRPVPQSYSAYTPRLQQLDAAHFADPAMAPATLLLKIADIDNRLPTLATGPSLLIIARWYDAVGRSPLGLVLRRRQEPRVAQEQEVSPHSVPLGRWVAVPNAEQRLVMARIIVKDTVLGKLMNLVARGPMLGITIRFDDQTERSFRFVPGMAQLGFLISPLSPDADGSDWRAALTMMGIGRSVGRAPHVVALRIDGSRWASLAYQNPTVGYRQIELTQP